MIVDYICVCISYERKELSWEDKEKKYIFAIRFIYVKITKSVIN